jgi:hypothetical protein
MPSRPNFNTASNNASASHPPDDVLVISQCHICSKKPCVLEQGLLLSIEDRTAERRTNNDNGFVGRLLSNHATCWIHRCPRKKGSKERFQLLHCVQCEIVDIAPPMLGRSRDPKNSGKYPCRCQSEYYESYCDGRSYQKPMHFVIVCF